MVINDKNQIGFIHNSNVPGALELVKSLITNLKSLTLGSALQQNSLTLKMSLIIPML